jgi:hypothetical protein
VQWIAGGVKSAALFTFGHVLAAEKGAIVVVVVAKVVGGIKTAPAVAKETSQPAVGVQRVIHVTVDRGIVVIALAIVVVVAVAP